MDAVDRAQEIEDRLARITRRHRAPMPPAASRIRSRSARDCDACGHPIPAKRLRALPRARLCIGCQIEVEAGNH